MWFFKKKDYLEGYDFEVGQIVKKNCFAAQGTIIRLNANNQKSVQVLWTKEAMGHPGYGFEIERWEYPCVLSRDFYKSNIRIAGSG